jgi:hypothetical protein
MSKTVKRVMTVMMIGVAMLGAKAEAHWINLFGRCVWHSGECVRTDEDPKPNPISNNPNAPHPVGEARVMPTSVDFLCPNGDIITLPDTTTPLDPVLLVAKRQIAPGDVTNATRLNTGTTTSFAHWGVSFSEGAFLKNPVCTLNGRSVLPNYALIRSMTVQMNLYCVESTNANNTPCPSQTSPHSTWSATCTSDFNNMPGYPDDLPYGASYTCLESSSPCHQAFGAAECPLGPPPPPGP